MLCNGFQSLFLLFIKQDIERLSKIGLCVHPVTLHRKLKEWQHIPDTCVIEAKVPGVMAHIPHIRLLGITGTKTCCLPTGHLTEEPCPCIYLIYMQYLTE